MKGGRLERITAQVAARQPIDDQTARMGYLYRVQCQLPIPRRETDRKTWQISSGMGTLWIQQGSWIPPGGTEVEMLPLPWGSTARLVLAGMHARWLQTGRAEVTLGESRGRVMEGLGINYDSSRRWQGVRDQTLRLSACTVHMASAHHYSTAQRQIRICSDVVDLGRVMTIVLAPEYRDHIEGGMIPLNLDALSALQGSPLAMDVYCWLAERLHRIQISRPVRIPATALREQLGSEYSRTDHFIADLKRVLPSVLAVYPAARHAIEIGRGIVELRHARPSIQPRR